MILYNVTVKLEKEIHDDWLDWMTHTHIPEVLETGYFLRSSILRLLEPADEDGHTYTIQYFCESRSLLSRYLLERAPALQADHVERYQGKFVAFRTIMEVLE